MPFIMGNGLGTGQADQAGVVELPGAHSDLLRSVLDAAAAHPWLTGLFTLLVLVRLVDAVRTAAHGRHPRDPQRLFVGADRATLLARAGRRCEHHSFLSGRCATTDRLQADHVHPHSRGGATSVANGQVLCRPHNARKANRIPWAWELDRLARRRQAYFPPGTPTTVVRRGVRLPDRPSAAWGGPEGRR
jgi:5-methylcytosine-specific restriction endonuclease McrA